MKEIGEVFQYYSKIGVAAIKLAKGLKVGDKIRVQGHTTDFEQEVESMQTEHKAVEKAKAGDEVGLKLTEKARRHDKVFKVE